MKKTIRTIGALALTIALMLSLASAVFAEGANLSGGELGGYTQPDTPTLQNTAINIVKELVANNASSSKVYAPAFSYVYTVTPAAVSGLTVTDDTTDHATGTAVTVPVKPGVTAGLKVNGGTAGDGSSAVGTLAFTNDTELKTTEVNSYNILLDFAGVTFSEPGVYRYQIAESLADSATYAGLAMVDGGSNERYLDVYVDGSLEIYGYVCMAANGSVTPSTAKTNGFVQSNGGADTYYTYDLELSKTVLNDDYGKSTHAFPFTVIFTNPDDALNGSFKITETAGTGSSGISPAAGNPTWSGVAKVKDGGAITYTGIPVGADVEIYETNDMTGVTYTAVTKVNGSEESQDNNVTWTSTPSSAVAQGTPNNYESTKYVFDTTVGTAVGSLQTYNVTNTMLQISPTGVVLRIAPYILMLCAGFVLLILAKKRRKKDR